MTDQPEMPVPDYSQEPPRVDPKRQQRVLYCTGLPLIGFGLVAGGPNGLPLGVVTAAGAFLLALGLPVRK